MLKLNRPLAFFDLETTGIQVAKDRIVEISILKVNPDRSTESVTRLVNPTIPIPPEASAIHGIYDNDVKDLPTFKEVAHDLVNYFGNADLAGFNSNHFDIPLLMEEFLRADVDFDIKNRKMVDVQNIFHKMEQRTLSAALKFYCNKELVDAHSAEADTMATYEILQAQIERYADLENDVNFLHEFSKRKDRVDFAGFMVYNDDGVEVFNFGKHKGKPVTEILERDPSYYHWIQDKDFPLYTKKMLTEIRLRALEER